MVCLKPREGQRKMSLFPAKSLELKNGNSRALLVLPGIGYGPSGRKSMQRFFRLSSLDLFVPDYIQKSGINDSVRYLQDYWSKNHLDHYSRVYVFCFIAGGYVLDRWLQLDAPQMSGVLLDRSPYQERAPSIVTNRIPRIARMLLGDFVFQLAVARYPDLWAALKTRGIRPGLVIEEKRSWVIKLFSRDCRKMGPIFWEPTTFADQYEDFCYVPFDHDSIYSNFHRLAPMIQSFIESGHFGQANRKIPPSQ